MCSLKKKNGTTFSIENTQCLSTDVAPSHWAVSIEGCLPSCAGTPSVQETAGFFQVHRQDLRLQGLAGCPSRLFVGLFESSSYSISSSSPAGHLLFLFSGRLALRRRGPIASFSHTFLPLFSWLRFSGYRLSKKVGAFLLVDAHLPWSTSLFPQVIRASGRAQSVGSSVVHPGTCRVSVSSCYSCGREF